MKNQEKLQLALETGSMIRFQRDDFEDGASWGYVLGVGPEFVLLLFVADDFYFNGFTVLRGKDLSSLEVPCPNVALIEKALDLMAEKRPAAPRIDLSSVESILRTADENFPLIVISREEVNNEVCQVGQVASLSENLVNFREIGTTAEFMEESLLYDTNDITRIDFGGRYETALALVAGIS